MSINCSNFCLYQVDGTCTLKGGNIKKPKYISKEIDDCPYYYEDNNYL